MAVADSLIEAGDAFDLIFGLPTFADDAEYDPDAVAEAIDVLIVAFITSFEIVEALEPPNSLVDLHLDYLEEFSTIPEVRDQVVSGLASATSWDEAFIVFEMLGDGEACEAMASESSYLGVDAEFPCNP